MKQNNIEVRYIQEKIKGEAREYGVNLFKIISQFIEENAKKVKTDKFALIGTGELTVTIKGGGIGGRNQEMLVSFLNSIKNKEINYNFLILAVNLDGIEGNSEAMGAIVDNYTIKKFKDMNLNPLAFLKNNDSNTFFKMLNDEIITGYTGINVNDLTIGILSFD